MAKNKKPGELNDSQTRQTKELRNQIAKTKEYLEKCQRCGFDVSKELEQTVEQLNSCSNCIKEFGTSQQ